MATAIDFAARFPDPEAVKAAGHIAVLAYVSSSRPGSNFGAKPMRREHADAYRAAGVQVVSIWQYGKPGNAQAPSDWTTGYEGGRRMGLDALAAHKAAGGPEGRPVFFAVDEDISLADWNAKAVHFFRGVNDAIGRDRTGIYGSSKACAWAIEDNVIGESRTPGKRWAWQTRAWSGNKLDTPEAVLYQRVIDTPSNPGPQVDGVTVDVNDILAADYGQWSMAEEVPSPNTGDEVSLSKPEFRELDYMTGGGASPRSQPPINFLLHTEEGNSSAENLARYCNGSNGVSYHYTLRDRILCNVVDTDLYSWSVLSANAFTINLCFAGSRSSWSRDEWLMREDDIEIAAYIAVQDCRKYNIPVRVIKPPYYRGAGISDHKYVTEELGIGTHTDVGHSFPWDVFEDYVTRFAGGGDTPMSAAEVKQIQDFVAGFCGPIGSDVKDIRQQLTGGRDKGEYPGWTQLDNKTVVDFLADFAAKVETRLKALEAK